MSKVHNTESWSREQNIYREPPHFNTGSQRQWLQVLSKLKITCSSSWCPLFLSENSPFRSPTSLWSTYLWWLQWGMHLHRFRSLITWSPTGSAIWEVGKPLGCGASAGRRHNWGGLWGFRALPGFLFSPCFPCWTLPLWHCQPKQNKLSFSKLHLVMVFYYSNGEKD